jgi:hypothetical protein
MKKMILAALLAVGGATTASADPLMKYTYADVSYQWAHVDAEGVNDSNGVDTKLSYSPLEHFALEGGYNYANSGFTGTGTNLNQSFFRYGGAGYYSYCNGIDLVGRVGGSSVNVDSSFGDGSDNGVYSGVGIRHQLTDTIELDADALYDSVNSIYNVSGGQWTYTGTFLNTLTDELALKLTAGIDADSDIILTGGLRLTM